MCKGGTGPWPPLFENNPIGILILDIITILSIVTDSQKRSLSVHGFDQHIVASAQEHNCGFFCIVG